MSDQVLMWAAYGALALGVLLIAYQLAFPHLPRKVKVMKFRRSLRSLDDVLSTWTEQAGSGRQPSDELARRRRPPEPTG